VDRGPLPRRGAAEPPPQLASEPGRQARFGGRPFPRAELARVERAPGRSRRALG
jgi:hypothetical protein